MKSIGETEQAAWIKMLFNLWELNSSTKEHNRKQTFWAELMLKLFFPQGVANCLVFLLASCTVLSGSLLTAVSKL